METYEAMYDKGKLRFKRKPNIEKAKVLVTFISKPKNTDAVFPAKSLGKITNIERTGLYDEYTAL